MTERMNLCQIIATYASMGLIWTTGRWVLLREDMHYMAARDVMSSEFLKNRDYNSSPEYVACRDYTDRGLWYKVFVKPPLNALDNFSGSSVTRYNNHWITKSINRASEIASKLKTRQ